MILFKYLPAERTDVLRDARIRYTQPGALNDPFEARPHVAAIAPHDEAVRVLHDVAPGEIQAVYAALPDSVRSFVSFEQVERLAMSHLEVSQDGIADILNSFASVIRQQMPAKLDELLGILSLAEDRESLLMWSHYAGSHSGFVVGFDATHPHFDERRGPKDEMRHLRRVEYRQERPSASLTELDGLDVFLVKSVHWAYECEWRIMRALKDSSHKIVRPDVPPVHLFQFPPRAVSEVVLGARIAPSVRREILDLLRADRYAHVRILESKPHDSLFKVSLQEIRSS